MDIHYQVDHHIDSNYICSLAQRYAVSFLLNLLSKLFGPWA